MNNARVIAQVGREMGASQRDIQIALMTALQESTLRNLKWGDRDSQGLFQQRPSQGWGTVAQVTNPQYASRKFYEALLKDGKRDSRSLTQAAQRVQRSAYPNAYAKHEGAAADLLAQLGGGGGAPAGGASFGAATPASAAEREAQLQQQIEEPLTFNAKAVGIQAVDSVGTQAADQPVTQEQMAAVEMPQRTEGDPFLPTMTTSQYNPIAAGGGATGKAADMVAFAKQFLGTPYKWGGTGPLGFDCSGLMQYVYRQFGIDLPRVSAQQAQAGARISLDQLKPGDMVAWDNSSRNNGADHIALYIGNGQVLHAPRPGDKVKVSALWDKGRAWGVSMNI